MEIASEVTNHSIVLIEGRGLFHRLTRLNLDHDVVDVELVAD